MWNYQQGPTHEVFPIRVPADYTYVYDVDMRTIQIRQVNHKSAFIRFSVYDVPSDYVNTNIIMQVSVYIVPIAK